jgi:quercetin dioxygenase-like cupin family protein
MTDKPVVCYWPLWTDPEGVSRQKQCAMTQFSLKSIQEPAAPQWQSDTTSGAMSTMITVLPAGWIGEWHENPKPQWIIPLSGRWFVQSMDGQRVEMGPGELSFGEDKNTRKRDGKQGHLSGTIGDEPAVLMIVQLAAPPTIASACRFR